MSFYSCNNTEKNVCSNSKNKTEIHIFKANQGWGFDIFLNKKKYIRQEFIPAIDGLIAFKTKEDAKKIGELMQTKICNNIMPPSITLEEINNLITID